MDWQITYLEAVEVWLENLDKQQLKSVAKEIRLLELCGNGLKLPHSKALDGGIFELREHRYGYYRFLKDNHLILLAAGNKKTQHKDIETARIISYQYEEKNHESKKF